MSCASEVPADGQLALLLSYLLLAGKAPSRQKHGICSTDRQPADPLATIINSALGCATQVFFT